MPEFYDTFWIVSFLGEFDCHARNLRGFVAYSLKVAHSLDDSENQAQIAGRWLASSKN
jgi:hypothetical protein